MNLTRNLELELHHSHQNPQHNVAELFGKHLHSYEAEDQNMLITSLYALSGGLSVLFNGHMIILYLRFPKLQQIISPVLLKLFVFCMIMGFVNGVFVNIFLHLLYSIPTWWCIFSQFSVRFFNDYFLLLIPILTIERYLTICYPYISKQKLQRFTLISTLMSTIIVALIVLFPYARFLEPMNNETTAHQEHGQHSDDWHYHQAISCDNTLNISNLYAPIMELILQTVCVIVVITVYFKTFYIAKQRLAMFSVLTTVKKERLRRGAMCIMLITGTFLLLTLPKGLLFEIASLCDNAWLDRATCAPLTNNLLHIFAIVSSFASFIAPVQFTLLNPKLRKCLLKLYRQENGKNPSRLSSLSS